MEQRKSAKVIKTLIIIVITMILVLVGVITYLYLQTDMLKSEKTLFFKYIAQIGDQKSGFINNKVTDYLLKKQSTPYTNNGTIKANFELSDEYKEEQDQYKYVNDFNISFTGQIDNKEKNLEEEITLNYSNDVNFPFVFKKLDKVYGIQTKYIGKNFIAIDSNNTENLPNHIENTVRMISAIFGNTESINDYSQKLEITEEDKTKIIGTYSEVLNQNLSDEKFSKVENDNGVGYKITLTTTELKNIYIKLLETLKDDEFTLGKINMQEDGNAIEVSEIEQLLEELSENEENISEEETEFSIIVYSNKNEISKLEISINNMFTVMLEKVAEGNKFGAKVNIKINNEDSPVTELTISAIFTGLDTMEEITEQYEVNVGAGESNTIAYNIENSIKFKESANIEDFTNENSLILNNFEEEKITQFLETVTNRITEVNKQQMEELGIEEAQNPLLNMFLFTSMYSNATIASDRMDAVEINSFNQKFELYAGTNIRGATVKGLLSTISLNNETSDRNEQIEEIHFNGTEYKAIDANITIIKDEINTANSYRVECEKNDDGKVYRIVINEK